MKAIRIIKVRELLSYALMIFIGLGIGLLVKEAIDFLNQPPIYQVIDNSKHFQNTSEEVVMYSTQWCPYCKKARDFLKRNNIAFDERNIESGSEKVKLLYRSLNKESIPQIIIGNKLFSGFNETALKNELKI